MLRLGLRLLTSEGAIPWLRHASCPPTTPWMCSPSGFALRYDLEYGYLFPYKYSRHCWIDFFSLYGL